jgi:hypothetical protein
MMIRMYIKASNHFLIEVISWHLPGDDNYPDYNLRGFYQSLEILHVETKGQALNAWE